MGRRRPPWRPGSVACSGVGLTSVLLGSSLSQWVGYALVWTWGSTSGFARTRARGGGVVGAEPQFARRLTRGLVFPKCSGWSPTCPGGARYTPNPKPRTLDTPPASDLRCLEDRRGARLCPSAGGKLAGLASRIHHAIGGTRRVKRQQPAGAEEGAAQQQQLLW